MNMDIGRTEALVAGARSLGDMSGNWLPMNTAPRDGSWVELKCSYGVAPWYCVARWTDEDVASSSDGPVPIKCSEKAWRKQEGGGPFDESSLLWRPYDGLPGSYVDPTGGLQNSGAYWRGALAAKYGLPLDSLERQAAQNAGEETPQAAPALSARPWWRRIFG